jgi:hypothetical protein
LVVPAAELPKRIGIRAARFATGTATPSYKDETLG